MEEDAEDELPEGDPKFEPGKPCTKFESGKPCTKLASPVLSCSVLFWGDISL